MNLDNTVVIVGAFFELVSALLLALYYLIGAYTCAIVLIGIVIRLASDDTFYKPSDKIDCPELDWFVNVFFWWLILLKRDLEHWADE